MNTPNPKMGNKTVTTSAGRMMDAFDKQRLEGEQEIIGDVNTAFRELSTDIITSKIKQRQLLNESIADGGPSNVSEALVIAMDICKVGWRRLSVETGIKKPLLRDMFQGKVDIPAEALAKIHGVFAKIRPDMYH
jgi:hypothetical protein